MTLGAGVTTEGGRGRLLVDALRIAEALRRERRGLTYAEIREALGCTYRTALRWRDALEAEGIAERVVGRDGLTRLRAARRKGAR